MSESTDGGKRSYRVIIVDDHPIVREGLELLLSKQEDLAICGQAEDQASALAILEQADPDLAIIDLSLAKGTGLDLIRQIRARRPEVRMLVSSMYDESLFAERALNAGAMGFINKQEATRKILEAVRCVLAGKIYLSEQMFEKLAHRLVGIKGNRHPWSVEGLSDRELEVLTHIGSGLKTAEIAERMSLSIKTVETYRQRIRQKLGLESGAALASFASRWVLEST